MSSTLTRLFQFAKNTEKAALENFTTEALAAALRIDASPFLHALERCGAGMWRSFDAVATQVSVEGAGILDLVLRSDSRTLIVEVKLNAPETGKQITNYLSWINLQPEVDRPALVVLGPRRLTAHTQIIWLSWQTLLLSVESVKPKSEYWKDLVLFLEEIGMADKSIEPLTPEEARSLAASHRLMRKVARMLAPAAARLNELWPGSSWPEKDNEIRMQLLRRFGLDYGLSISHRRNYRAGITLGAYDWDGEAWLGVWIWCDPKRFIERNRLYAFAEQDIFRSHWERDAGWQLLSCGRKMLDFADSDSGSKWLIDRAEELHTVGLFQIIERLGTAPEGEEGEGPR